MNNSQKASHPNWLVNGQINEVKFCASFLFLHPMRYIKGVFFTPDGQVPDEDIIKKEIYTMLRPHVSVHLNSITSNLLDVLRMECHSESLPLDLDRIHVANGTLFLNGNFTEKKEFCRNRLPVAYHKDAPTPTVWLKFLSDLLPERDIPTLQEYMGYFLIPTTKAQKMMLILGNGGEGKSRIGIILKKLLGINAIMDSIQKIETNRFARADLENKLGVIDDDVDLNALPKTCTLKTIVTAETPLDLEKKSQQSYQGELYARIIGFSNGELTAVNDSSRGFYRRQLLLYAKEPAADRRNDPFLVEKMVPELEGILLWCLEGLNRLIANNFQFTENAETKERALAAQIETDSIESFMNSSGYFIFDVNASASSRDLYDVYLQFCRDNVFQALSSKIFIRRLHNQANRYGLTYSNNVYAYRKRVWGFTGIQVVQNALF